MKKHFEVTEVSIAQLRAALESGATTAVELVEAYLARIKAYDGADTPTALNALVVANPEALADACLELLSSPAQWQAASAAGIARVERYYSDRLLFERYRQVYDRALQQSEEKH